MVEAGKLELIKIRYNLQNTLQSSCIEAMDAFTDMTKLVEAFGIETVL